MNLSSLKAMWLDWCKRVGAMLFAALLCLLPARAEADQAQQTLTAPAAETPGAPSEATPWSAGVSAADQAAAVKPFEEGNAFLKDSLFKLAAGKYREALEHWDHPGIHFNLALALFSLDQPEQVYVHLKKALAYGEGPLDADKVERAKAYITLLEQQLTPVVVTCDQPGTAVRMDGQVLFTAPGKYEAWVRSGEHTWSASKPGYELTQRTLVLKPKEPVTVTLHVYEADELTTSKRRYSGWVPAIPIIAGVAILGGGIAMNFVARDTMAQFENELDEGCDISSTQPSCEPSNDATEKKEQAEMFQIISIAGMATGGAAIATGLVLLSLNRKSTYRMTPEELEQKRREDAAKAPKTALVPLLSPGFVGLSASGSF
jgi:hypothetical protein